ncbi:MAG: TIGR00725 family protein [Actinomycetota bacterium]|nr:TIGR00725 family protein [Actinomycetota bacterium]
MASVYVAVVGPGDPSPAAEADAEAVGRLLADRGAVVVCGGLGGVMAAACRGAKAGGGTTVGILPGVDRAEANAWVDVAVTTGMGEARNALVVRSVDAVVAVAGGYGTLSEIALALRLDRPVVGLASWDIEGVRSARDPADAVAEALQAVAGAPLRRRP